MITRDKRAGTTTVTSVADSATAQTLLAAAAQTAGRLGASIYNSSSADLYVKLGPSASTTDYTVKVVQGALYELPYGYTGIVTGIWASDPGNGAALVTEFTA